MNNDKFDAETSQVISEADALEAMFQSSGWSIAEKELTDFIGELRDTRSVPREGDIALNLEIRDGIANGLEEWVNILKSQINNVTIMVEDKNKSTIIERR